ncbi:hypothetical protein BZA77DRAFT_389743 [Pyronema omphalodes]|nr:hypothetical protein BZA77DRAFT_389743 [Pyronema omphalodes]
MLLSGCSPLPAFSFSFSVPARRCVLEPCALPKSPFPAFGILLPSPHTSRHLQPSSPTKTPTIPTAPPTQTPRTLQEALKLIIGLSPVSVNGTTYTPTQFQPTREVIPIATEIIENLHPDGPQEVPRETLLKVADEYMAMSHTVKLLEDGLHDALRERDALYAQLIAYEKELKDQAKEFEDRRKQERLLLEALYGDDDAEELLAPGENRIVED